METKVSLQFTKLKIFNPETNQVVEHKILGKLKRQEVATTIANLDMPANSLLIVKELVTEEFLVDSLALYALKM